MTSKIKNDMFRIANSLLHPGRKTQIFDWDGVQFESEFLDGLILNPWGLKIYVHQTTESEELPIINMP
jgi:hypothetical protein